MDATLSMSEDLYNAKYKDKLELAHKVTNTLYLAFPHFHLHMWLCISRSLSRKNSTIPVDWIVMVFLITEFKYQGLAHEVFVAIVRGLSGAKVTRPGKFRSSQDGYAVKSSLKAEDGVLYPLEKSFFFLPKPPTLILHEEV